MDTLALRLRPLTAFGSPLLGDTLFGQLCWAIHHRCGQDRLRDLLVDYTAGRPFVVVSDVFPDGWLPRPTLPQSAFPQIVDADRKVVKRRRWIPLQRIGTPLADLLASAQSDFDVGATAQRVTLGFGLSDSKRTELLTARPQPHNSINRLTGTTGRGEFAPYTQIQRWHQMAVPLCCWLVFDPTRISAQELQDLFADIGDLGFGRDASIGLGKFELLPGGDSDSALWSARSQDNACLTLAPCAPQGLGFDPVRSFYEVFTRFGRHGDAAVQWGSPFKTPLLLARSGAVLTPAQMPAAPFIGQGLGGAGQLSKVLPETVHQGYAPCVFVHLPPEIAQ